MRTGAKIDWVQCDGCELWYHLKCVGLKPDQCTDDDDYHCPMCARRSPPPVAAAPSPPAPSQLTSKLPTSSTASAPGSSAVKRKASKRPPERVDPLPNSKLKASTAKTVSVTSAVSSKDSPSPSVDSNPSRTVATGGFAAFAGPGSFGGTKLFEFSTLAQNAVRRPSTTCSKDDGPGKSLSATTGSSFTFGQYLYTPWLAKSALAPR